MDIDRDKFLAALFAMGLAQTGGCYYEETTVYEEEESSGYSETVGSPQGPTAEAGPTEEYYGPTEEYYGPTDEYYGPTDEAGVSPVYE